MINVDTMVKTKTTPRKTSESGWKPRIPCILCGKSYGSIKSLRRHVNVNHSSTKTWYKCKICKRSYGRNSDYLRHQKSEHPMYKVEPEIIQDNTREEAKAPSNKRPFESLTKSQLDLVKFRVVPGRQIIGGGPPEKSRPVLDQAIEQLKEDLALSDDSSEASGSMANTSETQGQTLVRNTGCLSDLLQLLRTSFPKTEVFNRRGTTESWFEDVGMTSVELWSSVASTLCMCVNNPRSDENQSRCGLELGFMFSLIKHCDNPSVLRPLLSLVGFTVASNACTQKQVRQCGGLMVLMARLKVAMDLALCQNAESDSHRAQINLAVALAGTIDSCILDNVENAEDLSKGDAIPSMLQLLLLGSMKQEDKLQVVLTLGHMLELSCESRVQIDAVTSLPDLVKLLTESEDEEFSKAVKYLLQMCISRNDKNLIEAEEENLDAVRRENGKKMLMKIDEISERLKAIEKEAEEKSLALQQTGQRNETIKKTCWNAVSMTPQEKNLLLQLEQEREDRKRMESLAFHMHSSSPFIPHYGIVSKQCLSEQNIPVQGQSFIESDRQRLRHQILCCSTPEILHHQKLSTEHPTTCCMNNCPEYPREVQRVGCPVAHGSCVIGPDENKRIHIPNHLTTQHNYFQETNTPCETIYHHPDQPSNNTQMKSFSHKINPTKSGFLDHRGDRNKDNHCLESYENEGCSASNVNGLDLKRGQESVSGIDQVADTTINECESTKRITLEKNIASSNLSYQDIEPERLLQGDREGKVHDEQMTVISTSATDRPKRSTSNDHFTDSNLNISENTHFKVKESCSQPQETRRNVSSNILMNKFPNSSSDRNCNTSFMGDNYVNYELNSSGTKSCAVTESEKNDVFVKPKTPPIASCYKTPLKRPVNTRMTSSLGSRCGSYSSVMSGTSLYPKSNLEESYPDSDCSSVIDTRSEFDFDLVKAAQKNKLSQNICYSVTPVRRNSLFVKGHQSCRFGIWESQSNITRTPCSVKSIGRVRDHKDIIKERCSETFSTDEGSLFTDERYDAKNYVHSIKENLECCDNQMSREELRVSKCPGCTTWLTSPSNDKRMLMNSRTFNLLLETSLYTCENHKAIRDCERKFIQKIRKNFKLHSKQRPLLSISQSHKDLQPTKRTLSVYDFMSTESDSDSRVTPPRSTNSCKYNLAALKDVISRRSRIPYTEEEVDNIMNGVEQFGTRWNQILVTFKFHPSRTATDLKDKYKRLLASQSDIPVFVDNKAPKKRGSKLFSMCEERRLIRGVKRYGYNWKSILNSYSFSKGRTSQDLRNRWRTMHKKVTHV